MTRAEHPSAPYNNSAQVYADAFQDESLMGFPVDRGMIRMAIDLVVEHPRVLDAGCGVGQVTKMLSNWGCDAVGVDAAEKLIELARIAYPDLALTVGDLEDLPYPNEDFDLLVARYSIIHTSPAKIPAIISEFARVLRPGGFLLAEFQSSPAAATHPYDHPAGPAWAYNPSEIGALMVRAGLVERAQLLCPAQPELRFCGMPESHLVYRKSGRWPGSEPLAG